MPPFTTSHKPGLAHSGIVPGTLGKVSPPVFHLVVAAVRAFPEERLSFLGTIQAFLARAQGKHFNSHKPSADEAKALVKQTHRITCAAGRAKSPWMI